MARGRAILVWGTLCVAGLGPLVLASTSPLLAWRDTIYIVAGFAGIFALGLLLMQPLLASGRLPGLAMRISRRVHGWIGGALILAVLVHVLGLWITSPPDVIDALLLRSPTAFSVWGVIAMWAAFAAGLLALLRRRLRLRPTTWRRAHLTLTGVVVLGTVVHALLIEGTMEAVSKLVICGLVILAYGSLFVGRRV